MAFKTFDFSRVIGQKTDLPNPQILEDLSANTVVAKVRRKSQLEIRIHGIQPLLLQLISL
ncbi:hypothetical protein D3C81_2295850 [compost metagenome]